MTIAQRMAATNRAEQDLELQRLSPKAFWSQFKRQPAAFWFLCAYFMVEYVRPQSIYPALDFLPWGMGTLLLTVITYFLGKRGSARRFTIIDGGLVAFSVIVIFSIFLSRYRDFGIENLHIYVNWILVYLLVVGLVNEPRRLFIFLTLYLLWSLKMAQHGARGLISRGFAFTDWGITGPPGWFHNSGEYAIQMCIFLAMGFYFFYGLKGRLPRWAFLAGSILFTGSAALGVLGSSTRGGQLAAALVVFVIILQGSKRMKKLTIGALALLILWMALPEEQKARFDAMGDDDTSQSRLVYWGDGMRIMNEYPVLGIGYKAWLPYYRSYYNPYGELPHNIFVEAGAELGYVGLFGFFGLIGATFVVNRRTRRLARQAPHWDRFLTATAYGLDAALVGYLAAGFFVTVLFYPFFWVNLAFTACLYETTRRAVRQHRTKPGRLPGTHWQYQRPTTQDRVSPAPTFRGH